MCVPKHHNHVVTVVTDECAHFARQWSVAVRPKCVCLKLGYIKPLSAANWQLFDN
jgi:hypothetical protein